jgi:serine/threonine protein kinase
MGMTTTAPAFLPQGAKIGNFEIDTFLGNGACATIYRAKSRVTGKHAVVKIFAEHYSSHSFYSMILLSEVDRAVRATHPNVISLLESGFADGQLYMAMDLVDGQTLWDRMARGKIKAYDIFEYGAHIAAGLDWMEKELGHFHRDIKPANIMISDGKAILIDLDFDTLRIMGNDDNMVWGTPEYLAPELMQAGRPANRACDIYALGCSMYHALTGKPPFWHQRTKDSTPQEVAELHQTGTLKLPSMAVPGLPRRAEVALTSCMARRPSQRPASYAELIEQFRAAQLDCMAMDV